MKLLERDCYLNELEDLLNSLPSDDGGYIVSISGEAGIGKTSLINAFKNLVKTRVDFLAGICDNLYTPRPLAPVYDFAEQINSDIINQLDSGIQRPSIFSNLIKEIRLHTPCIIVIEDVHWADDSTFDLIKFLGRRINTLNVLFIITYRDDEIKPNHQLKSVLNNLPSGHLKRMNLSPLSEKAVKSLALSFGREDINLYSKTGGNPLLVTEVLTNTGTETPPTIKELMSYKMNLLSSGSRSVVEMISIIPGKVENWLAKILIKDYNLMDDPFKFGILKMDNDAIIFKHELIRIAIEDSLFETKRIEFNSLVLSILLEQRDKDHLLARIIHHAANAKDIDTIIEYAPRAAVQASNLGAHKQAAKHYLTALNFSHNISKEEKLKLLRGRAHECNLTGQVEEGVKACELILEILKESPDPHFEGEIYRVLSKFMWDAGEDILVEKYLNKSVMILEKLSPSKQLAMAYSNLSSIYSHRNNSEMALVFGEKAIGLAGITNDLETKIHSLNNFGVCKMRDGIDSGEEYLKESLRLSLENNFYEHAGRAYVNLGAKYLWQRNLTEAEKYLATGLEYCIEKDLDSLGGCMAGDYAKAKLFSGDWDDAAELSNYIFKSGDVPAANKVYPLCVIGQIRTRRMDPGALKLLDEADYWALKVGEIDRIVTVKAAKAEYFWLQNKSDNIIDELEMTYKSLVKSSNHWAIGEIAYWLWKSGKLTEIPKKMAKPYLLQIKGKWKAAAEIWNELGCPYEYALALSEGNEESMKKALEIFDDLGATAASQLIKQKMRERGFKSIPRGPRKSTMENPGGLTMRQIEVLKLVAKGLSNNEIGMKLYISPKTVDHHVSTILAKLNIHSRTEAASFLQSNRIS